MVIVL